MNIPFSPPDISEEEIEEVISALKSGWITTGPKTKEFEKSHRQEREENGIFYKKHLFLISISILTTYLFKISIERPKLIALDEILQTEKSLFVKI